MLRLLGFADYFSQAKMLIGYSAQHCRESVLQEEKEGKDRVVKFVDEPRIE